MIGDDRLKSNFDLSLPTGMALATIFNSTHSAYDEGVVVEKIKVNKNEVLVVSWYTIIRNIINVLSERDTLKIKEKDYVKEIAGIANEELRVIMMLCNMEDVTLKIIAPDYSKIKYFNYKDMSNPTMGNIIYRVGHNSRKMIDAVFDVYKDHIITDKYILLFSYITLDLLNAPAINIRLLESYTSKVIEDKKFNKKYRKSTLTYDLLPMTPTLLAVFGDSSMLLDAVSPKYKKHIMSILEKNRVTIKTSSASIRNILNKDDIVPQYIKDIPYRYK